jgi:hypothetical protein
MDMAYDRYDTRDAPHDERSRWSDDRFSGRDRDRDWRGHDRDRGNPDDRGFFERAGDEVASWFGDEDAERRRREDRMRDEREGGWRGGERERGWRERRWGERGWSGDDGRRDFRGGSSGRRFERPDEDSRGPISRASYRGYGGEDFEPTAWDRDRDRRERAVGRDFADTGAFYAARGGQGGPSGHRFWEQEGSRSGFTGSSGDRSPFDPHYRSWRDRHMSELDSDYDEYSRENQARFEREFGTWRERRQQKRGLLGQIREHMEVVGSDDQHVGAVDRVAGDRIILAKSDPESGGVHHSLSCADIDRVEGDRVILDCSADEARGRWRDESRSRALFEREDQGEMGPRMLDRSFEGTYR